MKKRIFALILVVVMLCVSLTSCEVLKFINNVLGVVIPDKGDLNILFEFIFPDPNRCTSHAIVPLDAIAPTCTTPGMSGGQVCQNCGAVIVAQTELPALHHEYTDDEDATCNRCDYNRTLDCNHVNTEIIPAIEPTCTTTGRTEAQKCLDCEKILSGYEIIQVSPHLYGGDRDLTCNICGYERKIECPHDATEKLAKVDPTCTSTGLTEGVMCVHCGEVIVSQHLIDALPHKESEWIVDIIPTETEMGTRHTECINCKVVISTASIDVINPDANKNVSEGLVFVLNEDNNSYSLTHVGTCTDSNVVIPSYHNGKPVTKIGDGAFINQSHIVSITIPEGILNIGSGAFKGCTSLEAIIIPSTVTTLGEYAFYECKNLTSVNLSSALTLIEKYTFYSCISLADITIPRGVTKIEENAFFGCVSLGRLVLPETLEAIGDYAFAYVGLSGIIIPNSVKSIGDFAFSMGKINGNDFEEVGSDFWVTLFKGTNRIGSYAFPKKSTINYMATAREWNEIIIHPMNYNYKVVCTDIAFIH